MPNACESLLRLQEIYTENTNEMKNKINILEKYIPKNIFARKSDLKRGNGRERLFVYFILFA